MARRLRLFLLCLLMAALPLQGLAAVMKAACGLAHHHASELSTESDHVHGHDAHVHDAHHHAPGAVASGGEPAAEAAQSQAANTVAGTCSACASCYTAAVGPPPAIVSNSSTYAALSASAPASQWLAGFIPAGLERPPKSPFA